MNKKIKQDKKEKWLITLFIIGIVIIWLLFPWALSHLAKWFEWKIQNNDDPNFGTFGDTFGALNTLFSGLAFATLIITLILQRKELQLQRKAVQDQQLEIQKSNDIAEAQRKITEQQSLVISQQLLDSKVQSFYQLFFKYLDEKKLKIQSLKYATTSEIQGERLFSRFKLTFENQFSELIKDVEHLKNINSETLENILNESIYNAKNNTNNKLMESEYFEYICFILRFIDENSSLGIEENAIRTFIAYQSIPEMFCMMILALEDQELYDYIEKYALLRKINTYDDPWQTELVIKLYSENAYSI